MFIIHGYINFLFRTMNEDYNAIQSNFESTTTSQSAQAKNRNSRTTSSRSSRMIQQSQQQQQNTYQVTRAQQANPGFQPQSQQPQSYAMEIQTVQLASVPSQPQTVQISAAINDQSATVNSNQISSIAAVQNLVTVQHNFAAQAGNSPLQSQHPAIRPLPTTSPMSSKPYKIVQPQQQCYKFPNLVQNLNAQQCKFNTNSFKVKPRHNTCRTFMAAEFTIETELKRHVYFSDTSHATNSISFFDGTTVTVADIAAV